MKSISFTQWTLVNHFKIAVTFLAGYNSLFFVTKSNNKIYFAKWIIDKDGCTQNTISQDAYEIESLNNEIKRIIFEEEYFTEIDYPITIKPNFSTLDSIIETSRQEPVITFLPDDSLRDLLGFSASTVFEEYNLSSNPVNPDLLSIDKTFLQCDTAHGMIFTGNRSGIIHNFTMDFDPR